MIVVRPFGGVFATEPVLPGAPDIPVEGSAETRSAPAVYATTDVVRPTFFSPGAQQLLYTGADAAPSNPYEQAGRDADIAKIPGTTGGGTPSGNGDTPQGSPAPPQDPINADPSGTLHEGMAEERGTIDVGSRIVDPGKKPPFPWKWVIVGGIVAVVFYKVVF